ncbi:polysaccharide deacetylase family protein [Bacteroidota bacterium]
MNKKIKLSLTIVLAIISITSNSQTVIAPYEVGTWHGFRQTAINYTFDDGTSNQFAIAIPMFNEFDFELTMFTVTNWSPNWTALQNAADEGHEIASHTVTHANFGDIDSDQEKTELKDSKEAIESNITGQQCITMAYPYCVRGNDSICSEYYIAARACQGSIESRTPGSFMNVSSIICGDLGAVNSIQSFKSKFESAANSNGWCVFLLHGVDNDGGYSPLASDILRSSLEFLDVRRSKFWVTTFKNSALYVKERNAVTVTETNNEDTLMTLQVTDTLIDSIYNYPISIRRPLPENWPSADVIQNNDSVSTRIVLVDSIVYLMFDVIPDAGEVKISKNNKYVVPEVDTIPLDTDTIPTTSNPDTTDATEAINFNIFNNEDLKIKITENRFVLIMPTNKELNLIISLYDLKGTNLFTQIVNHGIEGESSFNFSNHQIAPGVYIVKVSDGNNIWSDKVAIGI